jgi:hypothetical protein
MECLVRSGFRKAGFTLTSPGSNLYWSIIFQYDTIYVNLLYKLNACSVRQRVKGKVL